MIKIHDRELTKDDVKLMNYFVKAASSAVEGEGVNNAEMKRQLGNDVGNNSNNNTTAAANDGCD